MVGAAQRISRLLEAGRLKIFNELMVLGVCWLHTITGSLVEVVSAIESSCARLQSAA